MIERRRARDGIDGALRDNELMSFSAMR